MANAAFSKAYELLTSHCADLQCTVISMCCDLKLTHCLHETSMKHLACEV